MLRTPVEPIQYVRLGGQFDRGENMELLSSAANSIDSEMKTSESREHDPSNNARRPFVHVRSGRVWACRRYGARFGRDIPRDVAKPR